MSTLAVRSASAAMSQTQQVNTQTGFPGQKSDLPLESDKSTNCHQKVQNRWNRPKGRFFHFATVSEHL